MSLKSFYDLEIGSIVRCLFFISGSKLGRVESIIAPPSPFQYMVRALDTGEQWPCYRPELELVDNPKEEEDDELYI